MLTRIAFSGPPIMKGDRTDKPGSRDSQCRFEPCAGAPARSAGPGTFGQAGPLGLQGGVGDTSCDPLSPAGRHGIVFRAAAESGVHFDFAARALHPVLSVHTLRVLQSLLRAARVNRVHILSTSRTPADDARVALKYFQKRDFHDPKHRDTRNDPLAEVYVQAMDSNKSQQEIVDDLEDKLAELGPLYTSQYRRPGTLLDSVNIAAGSIRVPEAFRKAVAADSRVENFLDPPMSPHYHLEFPQPRAAGSGKDGAGAASEAPPPPPKAKAKTWIEFRVLEEGTGEPIGGVRLRVTTPDGIENFYTADSSGLVRIDDLDPGQCDLGEMIDADALEVVSIQ
jgi:hypothetical protein